MLPDHGNKRLKACGSRGAAIIVHGLRLLCTSVRSSVSSVTHLCGALLEWRCCCCTRWCPSRRTGWPCLAMSAVQTPCCAAWPPSTAHSCRQAGWKAPPASQLSQQVNKFSTASTSSKAFVRCPSIYRLYHECHLLKFRSGAWHGAKLRRVVDLTVAVSPNSSLTPNPDVPVTA